MSDVKVGTFWKSEFVTAREVVAILGDEVIYWNHSNKCTGHSSTASFTEKHTQVQDAKGTPMVAWKEWDGVRKLARLPVGLEFNGRIWRGWKPSPRDQQDGGLELYSENKYRWPVCPENEGVYKDVVKSSISFGKEWAMRINGEEIKGVKLVSIQDEGQHTVRLGIRLHGYKRNGSTAFIMED